MKYHNDIQKAIDAYSLSLTQKPRLDNPSNNDKYDEMGFLVLSKEESDEIDKFSQLSEFIKHQAI